MKIMYYKIKSDKEIEKKSYYNLLPKKYFWEKAVEWLYSRLPSIVCNINEKEFNRRCLSKGNLEVYWNDNVEIGETKTNQVKVITIGQSHIDSAWLWRESDCRQKKVPVTFARALYHMEKYPNSPFTFTSNYALYYDWIKQDHPKMWEDIKSRVKEGRWEVTDGAWVENDCNIPSGESLIRQRLMGQYFYLENFGFMSDIAWADDVFGFPYQLPQILAKCNARFFLTNKFCYNDTNKFPYHTLLWRGPDGVSEVLLAWNQHKNNWHRYLKTFRELSVLVKSSDNEEKLILNYMSDLEKARESFEDGVFPYTIGVYGAGDGGNGPKPLEIIEQLCWDARSLVKMMTMKEAFSLLDQYRNRLPIWQDELYLEKHRGCLTSISMIKENNKTSEVLLHSIETLNACSFVRNPDSLKNNKRINIQPQLNELWKKVLFLQFHDVLPGSSIIEVYRDAARDYESVYSEVFQLYNELKNKTSDRKNTTGDNKQIEIDIINDLSFKRGGVVSVNLKTVVEGLALDIYNDSLNISIKGGLYSDLKSETGPNSEADANVNDLLLKYQIMPFPFSDPNREFLAGKMEVTGANYLKDNDGMKKIRNILGFPASSNPEFAEYDKNTGDLSNQNLTFLENEINLQTDQYYIWIIIPERYGIEGLGTITIEIKKDIDKTDVQDNFGKFSQPILDLMKNSKIIFDNFGQNPVSENKTEEIIKMVENNEFKLEINCETGAIIGAYNALSNEKLPIDEIRPILYLDKDHEPLRDEDAWNIYPDYFNHPLEFPKIKDIREYPKKNRDNLSNGISLLNNPVTGILIETDYAEDDPKHSDQIQGLKSKYYWWYYIIEGLPYIFCKLFIDNHDIHKLMKFRVVPAFNSEETANGMQYGAIKRVTVEKNRFNNYKVKFEYPNQQWSSVQGFYNDNLWRVSLLNRNKYGIFVRGSIMELSLHRSNKFRKWTSAATLDNDNPRPKFNDLGYFTFNTAVYVSKVTENSHLYSDWKHGWSFNYPFIGLIRESKIEAKIPIKLREDYPNIVIGSIKVAEQAPKGENPHPEWFLTSNNLESKPLKWIIVRIAEMFGQKTEVYLDISKELNPETVIETDMLERRLDTIAELQSQQSNTSNHLNSMNTMKINTSLSNGSEILITMGKNEIKTIAIGFKEIN